MQRRPSQTNTNINIEEQVEKILKEFFPHHSDPKTPAQAKEFDEIKQLVLQDARKNELIQEPDHIRIPSITKLIETQIIEKTIKNALETYTALDKNSKEANDLREHIKKELDKLSKNNKNYSLMMKNNKIRDTLIAMHLENYCLNNQINFKKDKVTNQINSLKLECEKLLETLKGTHPELTKMLRKDLQDSKNKSAKEELNTLINIVNILKTIEKNPKDFPDLPPSAKPAVSAKPKEFGDLSEAEQTQVVTLGSKSGGGFSFDRSKLRDDPLPDVIRPHLSAPIDIIKNQTEPQESKIDSNKVSSWYDLGKTPTPNPYDTKK